MYTSTRVQTITDDLKSHLEGAQAIAAKAEDEGRDFTDTERNQVNDLIRKAQSSKTDLENAKADASVHSAISDLGDAVGVSTSDGEKQAHRAQIGGYPEKSGSIGQTFISSEAYQELLKSAPNGQFNRDTAVRGRPVGFKDLVTGGDRTGSAGSMVTDDNRGLLLGAESFQRPLSLRQLVTPGTTASDQVEYARVTSLTSNAAPVPEATTAAGPTADTTTGTLTPAEGAGRKPESAFSAVRVTSPVRTIAHWIPVTKRALSDAAQVRTLIDSFLQVGLEEELENQMIGGDGTGENFEGLASVSGTQALSAVADPAGKPEGFGNLLAVRRARTLVRLVGRSQANGVVLHPNDMQKLDEVTDAQARFYFDGPSGANMSNPLWGMQAIESEAATEGTAWVGDWRKAILWDREQASVTATDSVEDFFVRNLVAILAEMRAAFGVVQPSAFVRVAIA